MITIPTDQQEDTTSMYFFFSQTLFIGKMERGHRQHHSFASTFGFPFGGFGPPRLTTETGNLRKEEICDAKKNPKSLSQFPSSYAAGTIWQP